MEPSRRPIVLFVEDEAFLREAFVKLLQEREYDVICAEGPDQAIRMIRERGNLDLLLTDVSMALEPTTVLSALDTAGGALAGIALAKRLRRQFPRLPLVFWTFSYNPRLRDVVRKLGNARLVSKRQDAMEVLDAVAEKLDDIKQGRRPRVFLVHGHDNELLEQVRNLIHIRFGLPAPIILREQASFGKVLIEKIEQEALNIDLVIVLLTPDDKVISEADGRIVSRARQNVIFELGFFMGMMGRGQGSIIVMHKGNVELPSDVHGLLTLDVSRGLDAVEAELRRELSEWLTPVADSQS